MKNKYQLLVLLDLTKNSYAALRNAINMAKIINGTIDIFHVSPPLDVVRYENQISTIRAIDETRMITEKKLRDLVRIIAEEENITITYDFTFGNVKNEIQNHITKINPDIVVIGKRKKKLVNFLGDGITKFLLNQHSGVILIVGKNKKFQPNRDILLGFYSNTIDDHTVKIVKDLNKHPETPIKFFSIRKKSAAEKSKLAIENIKTACNFMNAVEYKFEESPYSVDGLTSYVYKNDVQLLCIGRFNDNRGWLNKLVNRKSEMDTIIDKLDVSLLVTGSQ